MSEYNRTTRKCTVSQLHPEGLRAVRDYFQEHQLGDPEVETLSCCETISMKRNLGGLFSWVNASMDTTVHAGILLTSQRLIWVRRGDTSGIHLTAADLKLISVREYRSILTKDIGLEVAGVIEGSKSMMRGYIGMGPGTATQQFCDEVRQAIQTLNPPVERTWPKWMGR